MASKILGQDGPPGETPEIFIALGANIPSAAGPPEVTLNAALATLAARGLRILKVSTFCRTPAWPNPADPPFVNAVVGVETDLQPFALLGLLHEVETAYGRKRSVPNAPRSLDLDLIDFRGQVERGPPEIPHPRMVDRRFVLEPLAEIAPGWRHPRTGEPVQALLAALG
jgi:2-amino-4-hydroxy-6-hydroxymethyldihydropteridine diphosphokinase